MTGMRCAVYGCKNTYYKKMQVGKKGYLAFHRFPNSKDPLTQSIRKEWLSRCRRDTHKFNPDTSHICSLHFREKDYERDLRNELLGLPLRNILKKTAVPALALYEKKGSQKTETPSSGPRGERLTKRSASNKKKASKVLEAADVPGSIDVVLDDGQDSPISGSSTSASLVAGPENCDYKCMYNDISKNYEELKKQYALLKLNSDIKSKKIKKLSQQFKYFNYKCYKSTVKTSLHKNQVHSVILNSTHKNDLSSKKKKRVDWTKEEIATAFTLRYYSKKCYSYLRNRLKYPLPGLSSLSIPFLITPFPFFYVKECPPLLPCVG